MNNNKSFTLVEILIVAAIITIIATIAIVLFNPWQQIAKGYDTRRKNDLSQLNKALEDYYNDRVVIQNRQRYVMTCLPPISVQME